MIKKPDDASAPTGHRKDRLAGTIRRHLSAELMREVKDPRLAALSIEQVDLSGDLGLARVGVRLMVGGDDAQTRKAAMKALARVAPGLRASLGPLLRMRRLPELRFFYDEGVDHRAHIEAVLAEIRDEDEAKRSSAGAESLPDTSSAGAGAPAGTADAPSSPSVEPERS